MKRLMNSGVIYLLLMVLLLMGGSLFAAEARRVAVGQFSHQQLTGWELQTFSGKTLYTLVEDTEDRPSWVLKAVSESSASGLVKHLRVDLKKTPYLHWRWKITNVIPVDNERLKAEDDYAARVYVIVDGGFLPWRSMALNYVWSHGVAKGERWNNAFAPKQSKMLSLRSKGDALNQWVSETRHVRKDFEASFGESVRYIDVIAIMTDTDNTSGSAESYYGDVYFSNQANPN